MKLVMEYLSEIHYNLLIFHILLKFELFEKADILLSICFGLARMALTFIRFLISQACLQYSIVSGRITVQTFLMKKI